MSTDEDGGSHSDTPLMHPHHHAVAHPCFPFAPCRIVKRYLQQNPFLGWQVWTLSRCASHAFTLHGTCHPSATPLRRLHFWSISWCLLHRFCHSLLRGLQQIHSRWWDACRVGRQDRSIIRPQVGDGRALCLSGTTPPQCAIRSIPPPPLLTTRPGPQSSGCEEDEYDSDQEGGSNPPASPFDLCVARFLAGTDDVRNGKFKLIPRIAEGSWVIKQSVGTTPVILGRKLSTQYHRGSNYMEVDIDIGSSTVAASVVNLVYGATKSLVIDMAVLFEGQAEDELPEQLLGTVRLDHMDLGTAPWLNVERGVVTTSEPPSV